MPDKSRIHASIAKELLFERNNHQRLVHILAKQTYAPLPPRPELRTHVIHHRNTAFVHLTRHSPVECWRINHDGEIGRVSVGGSDQLMKEPINLRPMTQNFRDADD